MPMFTRPRSRIWIVLLFVGMLTPPAWSATSPASTRPTTEKAATATTRSPSTPRGGAAKGVLPDPVLLDGSNQPAEKRPEYGMVGDFELPGDENAKNGRVGGPQNQQQQPGQQGQQGQGQGGLPMPPTGGSGQAQAGNPPPPAIPQQQGGGGGPENPDAAGKEGQGGQQGGQPQGQQVAQLQGEGGGPEQGQIGEKPQQVSIGDSAMQIKTVANAPSVVGQQQPAGKTQQHEKTTGTGGKGPTGSNSNKGTERGRVMPAGL